MTLLGSIRRTQLQMLLTRHTNNAKHAGSHVESEANSPRSSSPTPLLEQDNKRYSLFTQFMYMHEFPLVSSHRES